MVLNMGQILSIPFILIGIGLIIYSLGWGKPAMIQHPQKQKAEPTRHAKSLADGK